MRIYLDVCCLNEWRMIGSEVVDYEISKIPDSERREKVGILAPLAKDKIILEDEIIKRAKEIEKLGIKAMDALHVACAEKSADVMLTTDDSLIKKVKENGDKIKVRVMNPVRFVEEVLGIE